MLLAVWRAALRVGSNTAIGKHNVVGIGAGSADIPDSADEVDEHGGAEDTTGGGSARFGRATPVAAHRPSIERLPNSEAPEDLRWACCMDPKEDGTPWVTQCLPESVVRRIPRPRRSSDTTITSDEEPPREG